MAEIILSTILSLLTGLFGHFVFYPIIEAWHNRRIKRLARPTIGVLLNTIPFLVWIKVLNNRINGNLPQAFAAYCVSFLWNGTGVALGYLIDDWQRNKKKHETGI